MKDSGIEWIGQIPEGWGIGRVSYFYDIQLGKMLQPVQKQPTDTLENYLCAANLGKNLLKMDDVRQMWFSPEEKENYAVRKGDLLVVEGGDVASSAIVEEDIEDTYIQNALHRVRSSKHYDLRILRYLLMIAKDTGYIDLICNKATIAHFSKEKFKAVPCPVMPQKEQTAIANYLDRKCASIDNLIVKKQQLIDKLTEYKKSLIYEMVTGKREVPEQ